MAEIAEILGVTRQRVAQLIETYDDFPKPEVELSGGRVWSRTAVETWILSHPDRGPGRPDEAERKRKRLRRKLGGGPLFGRFTDLARQSIVKAQEEARLMQHNFIGTEHLLLGLLSVGDGVAWAALSSLGVRIGDVRSKVVALIGHGPSTPEGRIPFTPRSKKVLELALREALQLNHNYVGTEHVLLAIQREAEGVAWKALEELGVGASQLRETVLQTLSGWRGGPAQTGAVLGRPTPVPSGKYVVCTFCGKSQTEVDKLIAGPEVYICNECVALCEQIIVEQREAAAGPAIEVTDRLAALERTVAQLTERLGDELRNQDD